MTTTISVTAGEAFASVTLAATSGGRSRWEWTVAYGTDHAVGTDLGTLSTNGLDALRSLAGFLAAHAESREGGENADMFTVSRETSDAVSEAIYSQVGWED